MGFQYKLNDKDVFDAIIKAKELVESSATALEIMNIVKLILKYEMNVKDSVLYIIKGTCRRTAFEYTKRQISCKSKKLIKA